MKTLRLLFGLCTVVTGIAFCKKDSHNEKQKDVQAAVDKIRRDLSDTLGITVPSVSVLIETSTDKYFAASVAPAAQPVTAETFFRFASNTKNFTGTAILNMWEDGWLNYKSKIIEVIPGSTMPYVPNVPDWNFSYKNDITIEQLLQHAAGVFDVDNDSVPGYGGMSYVDYIKKTDPAHQFTTDEMIKVVKDKNLSYFTPGTGYHYSNTGYSILAEIIKRVYSYRAGAAKTYADYLNDYVIGRTAPVQLPTVHFPVLAADNRLPDPHSISTVYTATGITRYDDYNVSAHVAEGNGYGTMEDLNRYVRTLMKGQNVLQPATVRLMQTGVSAANKDYGLGCVFAKNVGYGHNGAIAGYLSLMVYDPEKDVSLIVMIPLWDLRNGFTSFVKCFQGLYDAAYATRQALGYPGRP